MSLPSSSSSLSPSDSPEAPALYASALNENLAALWRASPNGRVLPLRDAEGHALMAPSVEAAQALVSDPVTVRPLDARGRMYLRAALANDLAAHEEQVHVSPLHGSRLPQAFAWKGAEESPMPRVLRRRGAVRIWNGATPEDACQRALKDLQTEYPDAVIAPCPSGAYGLATQVQHQAARTRKAASHA